MTRHTKLIALLVVALMTLSVVAMGGVFAATTTVDSDWSDDETEADQIAENIITAFDADENETTVIQVETTTTTDTQDDFEELSVEISHNNVTHAEYDLSDVEEDDFDGGTDNTDAATVDFTIEHDDLDTLPGQAGNGTIVDVTITEVEDADDGVDTETEFVAEVQFDESHSVVYIADDDHDSISSMTEREGPGLFSFSTLAFWSDDDEEPDIVEIDDERTVHSETHNSTFILADSDIDDSFDHVTEEDDGFILSATEDSTILGATVLVDGELVPLFDGQAADWYDTDDTYAVLDGNEVIVEYGDDVRPDEGDDAEDVDVQIQTENALDSDFGIDRDEVGDLYGNDLSWSELANAFGRWNAFRM